MISKPMRIGSLNARSIFKESNTSTRRSFIHFLKSSSLDLDILCLQETSTLTRHSHLTTSQLDQFTRFMFPGCSSIITKHVAIICLRPSLSLDSTLVSMDERVAVASIHDQHHHTVCRIINTYAPADYQARQDFLCTFLSLPVISEVDTDPWMLVGDFNMNLHSRTVTSKPAVKPWYEWVTTHFNNCFPQGLSTFTRGDSRTKKKGSFVFFYVTQRVNIKATLILAISTSRIDNSPTISTIPTW